MIKVNKFRFFCYVYNLYLNALIQIYIFFKIPSLHLVVRARSVCRRPYCVRDRERLSSRESRCAAEALLRPVGAEKKI